MSYVRLHNIEGTRYRTYEKPQPDGGKPKPLVRENCIKANLEVPLESLGFIVGFRHNNIIRLEKDTFTRITYKKSSSIVFELKGSDKEKIELASRVILNASKILDSDLTHFISLPLPTNILETFDKFYSRVSDSIDPEIVKEVSVPRSKLHLTVSVHHLTQEDMEKLDETLNKYLYRQAPIKIHISGLKILKGSPQECRVLVTTVVDSTALDALFMPVLKELAWAGLSSSLSVPWHCTLMNTRNTRYKVFNAEPILEEFVDLDFGSFFISEVHLSKFSSQVKDLSGYYQAERVYQLQ